MKKLLLIIVFTSLISFANAQWQQTSIDSTYVQCLAIKGDTILANDL